MLDEAKCQLCCCVAAVKRDQSRPVRNGWSNVVLEAEPYVQNVGIVMSLYPSYVT